ncbi:MAG: hypothetical protein JKX78_02805 [Alteromonadaceae bacterium]|nr:hypothetical protein [Alteromonadaceae bacterium]
MEYLIYIIIVIIIAVALQPKPPGAKPATLSEVDAPTAQQGKPIPKVFGTWVVQSPNIVWYGDLSYTKIFSEGGK